MKPRRYWQVIEPDGSPSPGILPVGSIKLAARLAAGRQIREIFCVHPTTIANAIALENARRRKVKAEGRS